ncbi:MAG: sigma-70 family RNA polymerase sigma factor [Dehalococcoidia bacterium]|nr:sigma-70 family RNA polymerase sigma factor [Dehalococcoidia bacterium]
MISRKGIIGIGKNGLIEIPNVLQCCNGILNRENTVTDNNLAHHGIAISSFTALYEEHMTYVFRYINYRVGNRNEAEDLTSVVFEKALAAFHRYDRDKAAPQTWLLTIARNTVTDYFRKSSKRNSLPLESAVGIESADPSPQEETERREEYEQLRVCLATLAHREQEIISLKFGAELNNRQIASVLGLSENNVGTMLFRAVCKLRNCFKDWSNEKR